MEMLMIGKQCFYGPPLHFAKMREALTLAAGYPTLKMHITSEEGDDVAITVADLSQFALVEKNIYGEWDEPAPDPLLYLLAHSDETGVIKDEHILPLVERLSELAGPAYDAALDRYGEEQAQRIYRDLDHFTRMLADAYAREIPVEFQLEEVSP